MTRQCWRRCRWKICVGREAIWRVLEIRKMLADQDLAGPRRWGRLCRMKWIDLEICADVWRTVGLSRQKAQ